MEIKTMQPMYWPSVKKNYEEGIVTGNATFQTAAPEWDEWDAAHVKKARFVTVVNNEVLGWAAAAARGKGVGKKLLQALIEESEKNNFWTLQAGIFTENIASVNLHKDYGFRIIGSREKIGQLNGIWRDTLLLERRSTITGI